MNKTEKLCVTAYINKSLDFVESLAENPREGFSREKIRKIPLRHNQNLSTQIKFNIETLFIKEFEEVLDVWLQFNH